MLPLQCITCIFKHQTLASILTHVFNLYVYSSSYIISRLMKYETCRCRSPRQTNELG